MIVEHKEISRATLGRLPIYLDYLKTLPGAVTHISATAIAKALQRHQGRRTVSVRSFVVTASKGPLADGEKTDAHSWGRELAASANTR